MMGPGGPMGMPPPGPYGPPPPGVGGPNSGPPPLMAPVISLFSVKKEFDILEKKITNWKLKKISAS